MPGFVDFAKVDSDTRHKRQVHCNPSGGADSNPQPCGEAKLPPNCGFASKFAG